jgi:TolB-like protein
MHTGFFHTLKNYPQRITCTTVAFFVLFTASVADDTVANGTVKEYIAVIDLAANGITEHEAKTLTDKLRYELITTKKFSVIERSQMDEILKEQGFQQTGCTSLECAVRMGQLIGVKKMVAGSVGKVGETFLVTLRLIDVATGQIINIVDEEIHGKIDYLLSFGIRTVARKITWLETEPPPDQSDIPQKSEEGTKPPKEKKRKKLEERTVHVILYPSFTYTLGTYNTIGFSLQAGIKFSDIFLGGSFLASFYSGSGENKKVEEYDSERGIVFTHDFETEILRIVNGSGLVFYLEKINIHDFLIIAPGITAGLWAIIDIYSSEGYTIIETGEYIEDHIASYTFNKSYYEFFGPKLKIQVGYKRFFLALESTFLMNFSSFTPLFCGGILFNL